VIENGRKKGNKGEREEWSHIFLKAEKTSVAINYMIITIYKIILSRKLNKKVINLKYYIRNKPNIYQLAD
jgi:hypothetical protein